MRDLLRTLVLCAPAALLPSGCVDAPLTTAHLDPNGQLHSSRMEQGAFAARIDAEHQAAVQITAVLATQTEGPLTDAAAFSTGEEAVYLHLRADRLATPRPVVFVWTHDGEREEVEGVLAPSTTLAMASSHSIDRESLGTWTIEILGMPSESGAQASLFKREFVVLSE
ncbi:MAG TPA: hypothetical protein ENJ18_19080 [Nannocystis exedens]|nr:hypothetical protein [Nannocystis exedens]